MISGSTNYNKCLKCCPLVLTQACSHFLLVSGPINDGQFAVSRGLNQLLLQFSQVACCALLHGAVVAIETWQFALNLYKSFLNAINPQ